MRNYATHIDPAHKEEWTNLVSSKGVGVILRSLKLDYKFVRPTPSKTSPVNPEEEVLLEADNTG